MSIDYAAILSRRYQGRQWQLNGDDYEGLTMLDDGNKPSQNELDALWPEVKSELAAAVNAKTSARAKLKALGLTDDEIAALVG